LQRLRTPSARYDYFLLDCPASKPLWRAIFGTTSSIFDLWSRPWGVARLLDLKAECLKEDFPNKLYLRM